MGGGTTSSSSNTKASQKNKKNKNKKKKNKFKNKQSQQQQEIGRGKSNKTFDHEDAPTSKIQSNDDDHHHTKASVTLGSTTERPRKQQRRNKRTNADHGTTSTTPSSGTSKNKKHKANPNASRATTNGRHSLSKDDDDNDTMPQSPRTTSRPLVAAKNPFRDKLQAFLSTHFSSDERQHFFSNAHVSPERRAQLWEQQADVGEALVNAYSWAVPTPTSLRILGQFAPLVELGCGANAYWGKLLWQQGIDIVCYDKSPQTGGHLERAAGRTTRQKNPPKDRNSIDKSNHKDQDLVVRRGGPDVLADHSDRTLFLCYPDENDDNDDDSTDNMDNHEPDPLPLGLACLQAYSGDFVIHVGEVYGDSLSLPQAPWGRSSSPAFQQELAAHFHCILKVPLGESWIHVRDSLTVWKRTQLCTMVFAASSSDNENDNDNDDDEEEVTYRYIPPEEQLPMSFAVPAWQHLLTGETDTPSSSWTITNKEPKKKSPKEPSSLNDDSEDESYSLNANDNDSSEHTDSNDAVQEQSTTTKSMASSSYQCPW